MARSNRRRRLYYKKHRRRRHHPYHPRNYNLEGQQQLNSSGDSMMDCTTEHDDGSTLSALPLLSIDIIAWLPLPEISLLGPLRWCTNRVNQSLDWVKDTIFPSRVYHRELQETKDQLLLLQQQLEQLKAHTTKARKDNGTVIVKCNCQQSLPASSTTPSTTQHSEGLVTKQPLVPINSNNVKAARRTSNCLPAVPPLPLPPAPPPPPPPPPPPISQPQKLLVFKRKKTDKILDKGNKSNQRAMVTLSDIMNVKLKKVNQDNLKANSDSSEPAVIQLADIRNVQLKKTFRDKKVVSGGLCTVSKDDLKAVKLRKRHVSQLFKDENANPMVLRSRISREAVQFRKSLRKVSVTRSPGGTPMKGAPLVCHGTGLTPLMTTALQRKFKMVRSPSLSPKSLSAFSPN